MTPIILQKTHFLHQYASWLNKNASTDRARDAICSPFIRDGYMYATDGKAAVRVNISHLDDIPSDTQAYTLARAGKDWLMTPREAFQPPHMDQVWRFDESDAHGKRLSFGDRAYGKSSAGPAAIAGILGCVKRVCVDSDLLCRAMGVGTLDKFPRVSIQTYGPTSPIRIMWDANSNLEAIVMPISFRDWEEA